MTKASNKGRANANGKGTKIDHSLLRAEAAGKHRAGAPTTGLFPEVSRVALARTLGIDNSTVSYILSGRHRPKFEVLNVMAGELGLTAEELHEQLEEQRQARRQR